MSVETREALEKALTAHMADECEGAILTHWVAMLYGDSPHDEHGRYFRIWPPDQPVHVTGGLLDYAANRHTVYVEDQLIDQNDDEDDDL